MNNGDTSHLSSKPLCWLNIVRLEKKVFMQNEIVKILNVIGH